MPASQPTPAKPRGPFTAFASFAPENIYDGDTITNVTLDLGWRHSWTLKQGLRLYGIDTPEIHGRGPGEKQKALAARDRLRELCKSYPYLKIESVDHDYFEKYGRILCNLYGCDKNRMPVDDLVERLIAEGHGKPYYGGTKEKAAPPVPA